MKLKIRKYLENGIYYVSITDINFEHIEIDNIRKFGAPLVSIQPKSVIRNSRYTNELPIHDLSGDYSFRNEGEAQKFFIEITQRIKDAAQNLKNSIDNFTGEKDLEF
ncbi:MAG TPA: hypothetical protein VEA37_14760 [Flavobacterium sp.]|nr:hypothetical protein [Flavobacterium sp.]